MMQLLLLLRLIVMFILGIGLNLWLTHVALAQHIPLNQTIDDSVWVSEGAVVSDLPPLISRPEFPASSPSDSKEFESYLEGEVPLGLDGAEGFYVPGMEAELFSSLRETTQVHPVQHPRESFRSRLYSVFTEAMCHCDECYQPEWRLLESASFWIDSARPQNRMRIRWDYGHGMILPDRAEYFWARVGSRGPAAQPGSLTVNRLNYHELSIYTETAHKNFSAFVVTPYRSLYMKEAGHAAGFSDIQIGTKSLLHDTPLLQVSLQMTTTIPSANSKSGLGTGHVSLEPALLFGLALTKRDFLQAQVAEWIPLGGDTDYQGALLRWGLSWNRVIWQQDPDNVLTTNLDLVGWSFQDGAYTDPNNGLQLANNETYLYLGPGTRWLLCGKYEFGLGGIFALSKQHFAEGIIRTDFTMRY